jgi:hypothetical protein
MLWRNCQELGDFGLFEWKPKLVFALSSDFLNRLELGQEPLQPSLGRLGPNLDALPDLSREFVTQHQGKPAAEIAVPLQDCAELIPA